MNYKLAKQLKDAGYPQFYVAFMLDYQKKDNHKGQHVLYDKELYYIPTLDELIEECGEKFGELTQGNKKWIARSKDYLSYECSVEGQFGKTPWIAVAKLWLKLNEKK